MIEPYTSEEKQNAENLTLGQDGRLRYPDGTHPSDREAAYWIWGE